MSIPEHPHVTCIRTGISRMPYQGMTPNGTSMFECCSNINPCHSTTTNPRYPDTATGNFAAKIGMGNIYGNNKKHVTQQMFAIGSLDSSILYFFLASAVHWILAFLFRSLLW